MFRVEVTHDDPNHPNADPAHIGPAFDDSFAEMAKHFRGEGEVDLKAEALSFRDKLRAEAEPGYNYEVVELVDDAFEVIEEGA